MSKKVSDLIKQAVFDDYEKYLSIEDKLEDDIIANKRLLVSKMEHCFMYLVDNKISVGTIFTMGTEFTYKVHKVGIKHYHPSDERYNPFVLAKRVNRNTFEEINSTSDSYTKEIFVSRIKEILKR